MLKIADLLPNVQLQPQQKELADESLNTPQKKMLYWGLGSGKSLGALAAAENYGKGYTAITPASLRPNIVGEREKFTDQKTPFQSVSYNHLASGKPIQYPESIIMDESHQLNNQNTDRARQALKLSEKAKQLLLLTGSPIANHPSELSTPISMLTGNRMTPDDFNKRFIQQKQVEPDIWGKLRGVTPGTEEDINHPEELKALLKGKVNYFSPEKSEIPVSHETHEVEMSDAQNSVYKSMWNQLPWLTRYKLRNDYALSPGEMQRMQSFLSGPRAVSLSTYPFLRNKDPMKAFEHSTKLQKAHALLTEKFKNPQAKALIFSSLIDAGLTPYAAKLKADGISHAVFHGGLSDPQRKQLVEDYNSGKIRTALIGPSGMSGLSFKGTQLIQRLDKHWNALRGTQSEGRGIRYQSHEGLPEDLRNVTVQDFVSKLPLGFVDRLKSSIGFDQSSNQRASDDYLQSMSDRKSKLNQKFLDLLKEVGTRK